MSTASGRPGGSRRWGQEHPALRPAMALAPTDIEKARHTKQIQPMIRNLSLAVIAAVLLAPGAQAQGTAARTAVNDSLFAAAAGSGGIAELQLSELGVQKATNG